jgi:Zn-dependent protease with chaperone function
MAIAGGVRPPAVRILDQAAPNAAILGRDLDDATVVVTRGLLDSLSRDETQGVIAHLIGSVGNGDLRMATSLLSVWQTFGLLSVILAVPSAQGARRRLWDTLKAMIRRADHADRERVALLLATDEVDAAGATKQGCLGLLVAPFILAGATTQFLTSLGTMLFFGPLLTAVWRTRRFLADQTAVQLTRNPNGIAHALQRLDRSEMAVDGGATSALVFLHWPSSVTAKGWPSLGRFHPSLVTRVHRLEQTGAKRLRFSLEGPAPPRGRSWFAPLVWLLMGLVYALMAIGLVAAFVGAALMMGLTFVVVGGALFAIHAFFTNLPGIIGFVTTDVPKIGKAVVGLVQELWARR